MSPQTSDPAWCWAVYRPDERRPWNLARAAHLYRRAGFGAGWDQLQQALADGPQRTVDRLLTPEGDSAAMERRYAAYETAAARDDSAAALRSWWIQRMLLSPHPLLEKMTLFWHGYFGISFDRVKSAALTLRHVQLLRSHALGRFGPLLEALVRDPAMFRGLDAESNRKAQPNPSFPRALLESFVLGPGQFSEEDVRQAARAFTGWSVLRDELHEFSREHDPGEKMILGRRGNFDSRDVVRIALEQPIAPRRLVRRLYRWLICETDEPSDALLAPLVDLLGKDYDVGRVVQAMLRANLMFSAAAYRRRVKSPVEFALGILRGLEVAAVAGRLADDLAGLGQNLYHPPTIHGWPDGSHWINELSLLGRQNLAAALLSGEEPYGGQLDPAAVAASHGCNDPSKAAGLMLALLLQDDLPAASRRTLLDGVPSSAASSADPAWLRRFVQAVICTPEFQLA